MKSRTRAYSTGKKVWLSLSVFMFIISFAFSGYSLTGNYLNLGQNVGKVNAFSILFFALGLMIYLFASYKKR